MHWQTGIIDRHVNDEPVFRVFRLSTLLEPVVEGLVLLDTLKLVEIAEGTDVVTEFDCLVEEPRRPLHEGVDLVARPILHVLAGKSEKRQVLNARLFCPSRDLKCATCAMHISRDEGDVPKRTPPPVPVGNDGYVIGNSAHLLAPLVADRT